MSKNSKRKCKRYRLPKLNMSQQQARERAIDEQLASLSLEKAEKRRGQEKILISMVAKMEKSGCG